MDSGIKLIAADTTDAEVLLPLSGIAITFRCPKKCTPTPSLLVEIARMKSSGRLEERIRVSAWAIENMRKLAAAAIAEKRSAESARMRGRVVPFQLPFSFR
jgi:hypothetical protein